MWHVYASLNIILCIICTIQGWVNKQINAKIEIKINNKKIERALRNTLHDVEVYKQWEMGLGLWLFVLNFTLLSQCAVAHTIAPTNQAKFSIEVVVLMSWGCFHWCKRACFLVTFFENKAVLRVVMKCLWGKRWGCPTQKGLLYRHH